MLSLNEIRSRAIAFAKEWEDATDERAEAQSFWNDFFDVFGISRRRLASFEEPVKLLKNKQGFIDLFWKGKLLVEHKSEGRSLDAAYTQAVDYFEGIDEKDLPKYVLVSDFKKFRLHDLDENKKREFALGELPKKIELFGFISGYEKQELLVEDPVNIRAAMLMGELHDELAKIGYGGHDLEVFLVRILFCLFAEDSRGIFEERGAFSWFIKNRTEPDGSDLGMKHDQIFEILNTPKNARLTTLDEKLANFPYINGGLYSENLRKTAFNSAMRDKLLKCCNFDWENISPAVFGSLFQYVMDPKLRRDLGAHYTDEQNILKLIKPLFLDDLWAEFEKAKKSPKSLRELHSKLGELRFLDPACGCGNFLVITYREIRKLELEILKILHKNLREHSAHVAKFNIANLLKVDVDNFFGIEIEEFSVRVAEVAMWLMDHQMNELVGSALGQAFARIPLKKSATIRHANSLRIDWNEVLPARKCSFIISNPPFYGKQLQTAEQKEDIDNVFRGVKGSGVLDYVACWYKKAAEYIQNTNVEVGFVSTNSITQGEQVGILWSELLSRGVRINFAHQTFKWTNQARGKAQVFVVIIGFALHDRATKLIFEYDDVRGEPHKKRVKNINPYLIEGSPVVVAKRTKPICDVPEMLKGSQPTDDGNLLLSDEEN
ncbi:N-6 DNA methylase, partial [Candidatus Gracilibacteria bacterium]|nr:N-6 DNA methylase [Candidatus Gracilibacteria bacterium]